MHRTCDLRYMRYFIAVAEELNFRRAAERLRVAQPAISRAIRDLESDLETRLLERTNRRVELTDAGQVFLEGCRRVASDIEALIEDTVRARDGEIGHVRIGYTDFAINGALPAVLQDFRARFPEVSVDLVHMVTATQLDALRRGEIDVGFVTGPMAEPGLEHLVVQNERLVVVLPETHPLTRLPAVPLRKLAGEPFVTGQAAHWQHFLSHMVRICHGAGFEPRIVQEAYNSEGIFGLVAANMGISLHVEGAHNHIRRGVAIRPLSDCDHRVPTEAIWRSDKPSAARERFIETVAGWPAMQEEKNTHPAAGLATPASLDDHGRQRNQEADERT